MGCESRSRSKIRLLISAMPAKTFQKLCRYVLLRVAVSARIRTVIWKLRGAKIGSQTLLPRGTSGTWPHQVELGNRCVLQPDIFFNFDHYWIPGPHLIIRDDVFIGRGCEFNIRKQITVEHGVLIASGCTFIDHDHGKDAATGLINGECPGAAIHLCEGAWIGANSTILKGVRVGRNSVVGGDYFRAPVAGSVEGR